MLTTGLDGASNTMSASLIASTAHRCRGGLFGTDEGEAVSGHLGAVAHPPFLEVNGPLLAGLGIGDDDVGFAAVVGSGQQSCARLPAFAQRLGDRRQRIAGPQHLAAHQVGGQVAVAEPEPVRLHAVGRRVPPWRARFRRGDPSPRSGSMPPPRVYMQVSRSGQMRTPCIQASSPTLTTAVSSCGAAEAARCPRRRTGPGPATSAHPAGSGRRRRRRPER